jgi:hypothetical protein
MLRGRSDKHASRKGRGYRKVWQNLAEQKITSCPETVRRVLQELGRFLHTKRKFVVTTDKVLPPAPSWLQPYHINSEKEYLLPASEFRL